MIYYIWNDPEYGLLKAFVYGTPVNLAFCSSIVFLSNKLEEYGVNLTGIEDFKKGAEARGGFRGWILRRRSTIFWVGSWFYLDPDYVTLLLQKKGDRFSETTFEITMPSVLLAMTVWTAAYGGLHWGLQKGYALAQRLEAFLDFF